MQNRFISSLRELRNVRTMTQCAILVAIYLVLNNFSFYITPSLKFTVSYVAIAAIAMIAGPIAAFICGGAVEVLGFALHPGPGGYFPGFTITTMLTGLVMGCFFYRREIKLWRVIAARSIVVTVLHLGLNTFWLSMIYHDAFLVLLPGRIFKTVALLPLEVALILLTLKTVNIAVSRLAKHSNS